MSSNHPDLGVHEVPDPVQVSVLPVKHEQPGDVLGGPRHHHEVPRHVEVRLTLTPILDSGRHSPALLLPDNDTDLSESHQNTETDLAREINE